MDTKSLSDTTYFMPADIGETFTLAKQLEGKFKFLAGGTDVMVNRQQGNETSIHLIDISGLPELKGIRSDESFLRIGALERLHDLQFNPEITAHFPLLIKAALSVGSPLIRKSATLGGNVLCENRCLFYNQSEWWRNAIGYCLKCEGDICIATGGKNACFSELVSDTAPALIAMDTLVEIQSVRGTERMKLEAIYSGDGVNPRKLPADSILTAFLLPLNKKFRSDFYKLRERESLEFTSLTVAAALDAFGKLKIAMAGIDPAPVVVESEAPYDLEKLVTKALKGGRAVDNDMYSRNYRREMIRVYLRRCFESLNLS